MRSGGIRGFPALLAQPRLLCLSVSPSKGGLVSSGPGLGYFSLYPLAAAPWRRWSVCRDPQSPVNAAGNVLVCISLHPWGKLCVSRAASRGCTPPLLQPGVPRLGWGEPGALERGVQPIWGQIFPKLEPPVSKSLTAPQGTEHPPSRRGGAGW